MAAVGTVYPPAYLCTSSGEVMHTPMINLCGHLFERTVAEKLKQCPRDKEPVSVETLTPCEELGRRIQQHVAKGSSYAGRIAGATQPAKSAQVNGLTAHLAALQLNSKPKQVWHPQNVHDDDIHGLALFGEGFASGSKDGAIKLWQKNGQFASHFLMPEGRVDYRFWVTALSSHQEATALLSGSRNGGILAWSPEGGQLNRSPWWLTPKAVVGGGHKSKERNQNRVTCLKVLPDEGRRTPFFAGSPCYIHKLTIDNQSGRIEHLSSTKVHANDWVYCVQPLDPGLGDERLVVVIGASLGIWNRHAEYLEWEYAYNAVIENKKEVGFQGSQIQRPHISAISTLPTDVNKIAYTCFTNNRGFGPIRIVDLEKSQVIFDAQEHEGRSWSVAHLNDHAFATGADDRLVKVWDARTGQKAILTLPKHVGRVSCLLSPAQNMVIAAACPDDVKRSATKGEFTMWDLRAPQQPT